MTNEAKECLNLIIEEPVKIGRWLGFNDLIDIHNEWLKMMMFAKEDETLLAHRGSYKTTCLSLAMSNLVMIKPDLATGFLRKTDDDVKEIINQVRKILKSEVMQHLSYKIYGKGIQLTTDNAQELSTNLKTSTRGASQILGLGIKTSVTGKHFDLVITDDIVNLKDRISKPERELIKTSYMELQNVKNRGGRFLNAGTPWHKDDAISKMPNKRIYDCYSTGLITRDKIEELRQSMTPSLFAANYELKHIADGSAIFDNPQFILNSKSELLYDGIAHVDASYGGEDGTAFTGIKQIGNMFIVLGKRWDKHIDDCMYEIVNLMNYYRLGSIAVERNADKGYVAQNLANEGLMVDDYDEHMNKYIKISTYLRKNWGNIRFLEETDSEYINEILDYNENATHDDSPDTLSSLLRKITDADWLY